MTKQPVVMTHHFTKAFDGKEIIQNYSMTVNQGTIYGFLGANGAGKTTVFKMLTGLLIPTSGTATIFGKDMITHRKELQGQIGSMIETPIFYEHLSATENLEIHLDYMSLPYLGIEETLRTVGLTGTGKQAVSKFSLGMRQRLGIARAIIHKPKLLILDEPINGLDPMGIKEMRNLFLHLVREKDMTILMSSHILHEIEQIADTIGVIANGTMIKEVSLAQVRSEAKNGLEDYFLELMSGGKSND